MSIILTHLLFTLCHYIIANKPVLIFSIPSDGPSYDDFQDFQENLVKNCISILKNSDRDIFYFYNFSKHELTFLNVIVIKFKYNLNQSKASELCEDFNRAQFKAGDKFPIHCELDSGDISLIDGTESVSEVRRNPSFGELRNDQLKTFNLMGIDNYDDLLKDLELSKVRVALLDTGDCHCHQEFSLPRDVDECFKGGVNGFNFNSEFYGTNDSNGHGCLVSGILGARGSASFGFQSIGGPIVQITTIRFVDDHGVTRGIHQHLMALNKLISLSDEIKISQHSYSFKTYHELQHRAFKRLEDRGHLVIAPAGNSRQEISDLTFDLNQSKGFGYPGGSYTDLENILTVGNLSARGELNYHSNWSKDLVDLSAPGTNVWSTYPDYKDSHISFGRASSTSLASAHVTAAASLVLSMLGDKINVYFGSTQLKDLILKSSLTESNLLNKINKGRFLNVSKLIDLVESEYGPRRKTTTTTTTTTTTSTPTSAAAADIVTSAVNTLNDKTDSNNIQDVTSAIIPRSTHAPFSTEKPRKSISFSMSLIFDLTVGTIILLACA